MSDLGELLSSHRDLLERVLSSLTGIEALRTAATCQAFRDALTPSGTSLWTDFYEAEFGREKLSFAAPLAYARRYRTAFQRFRLEAARWCRERAPRVAEDPGPGARQGAASCTVAAFGGCFLVYGGWTDAQGIRRDLHVLRRREDGDWQWTAVGPIRDLDINGPGRATYGPSLTWVPDGEERAKLIVLGGVTNGGYRGATGDLHTIELSSPGPSPGDEGGEGGEGVPGGRPLPPLEAAWTEEVNLDGTARAYHAAAFLAAGSGAHASNTGKLWVFGGHDDLVPGGRIAALAAYDVASCEWFEPPSEGGMPEPCARLGHTCTALGGQIYVAGGCTDSSNMKPGEGGEELNDVWLLDTRAQVGRDRALRVHSISASFT